jgi:hypothetical protein
MAPTTIGLRIDEDLAAALTAEASRTGASISDLVRGPLRRAYADPRPSYGPGAQFSLVRDSWALISGDAVNAVAARQRLDHFRAELAAGRTEFALNTANASAIVPPGYLPLVADGTLDRPLFNACTTGTLAIPGPFAVPGAVTVTGVGDAVEGTNPSSGTLTVGGGNISPRGISGVVDLSRELADRARPAADAVILNAMRESYTAQAEAHIAAEVGTLDPVGTTSAANLARDVRRQVARMVGARRRRAAAVVVSGADALADACADAFDETSGTSNAQWFVQGASVDLSADLGDSTGEVAAAVISPASLYAWESIGQDFTWQQVTSGPAVIRLATWQYFAVKTMRVAGVRALILA